MKISLFFIALLGVGSLLAQSDMRAFTKIEIDGPLIVELVADETPNVEVLANAAQVKWEINGSALVVVAQYREGQETPKVRISVQQLRQLDVTGSVVLTGKGTFAHRLINVTLSGQSVANLSVDTEALVAKASGQSILTIGGTADAVQLAAAGQSVITATALTNSSMDVVANGESVVSIPPRNANTTRKAEGGSVIVD